MSRPVSHVNTPYVQKLQKCSPVTVVITYRVILRSTRIITSYVRVSDWNLRSNMAVTRSWWEMENAVKIF